MRGGAGRPRFTGSSDSLKLVSGRSTPVTAPAQTAAPSRKKTNIQRRDFTLPHSRVDKLLSQVSVVNAVCVGVWGRLGDDESS